MSESDKHIPFGAPLAPFGTAAVHALKIPALRTGASDRLLIKCVFRFIEE